MIYEEVVTRLTSYLTKYYTRLGNDCIGIKARVIEYVDFVKSVEESQTGVSDKHHVMPKCCGYYTNSFASRPFEFSEVNCGEDWWSWCMSTRNLVTMSIYNHRQCHKLLHELFPEHNGFTEAFLVFEAFNRGERELTLEEAEELKRIRHESGMRKLRSPEAVRKGVQVYKDRYGVLGACMNTVEAQEKARATLIAKYGKLGAVLHTTESQKKAWETRRAKYPDTNGYSPQRIQVYIERYGGLCKHCSGTIWINNGVENKRIKAEESIPVGYQKGRINQTLRSTVWCNNGEINKRLKPNEELPSGFQFGMLPLKKRR